MYVAALSWLLITALPNVYADTAPSAPERQSDAGAWVVKLHADWCGGCRQIGDIEAKLRPLLSDADARFITFDLTDPRTTAATEVQAQALGLGDFLARNQGRIGTVHLVSPLTGTAIGMWTARDSAEQMAAGIAATAP